MKTLTIEKRIILKRTGYKAHPYQEETQYIVSTDGLVYGYPCVPANFRKPYQIDLKTRSVSETIKYRNRLGRSEADKWLKELLEVIINDR